MFKSLKNAIDEHKKYSELVKVWDSEKLFSQRDAAARCTCDFLRDGKIRTAVSTIQSQM